MGIEKEEYLQWGQSLIGQRKYEEALEYLDKYIQGNPMDVQGYFDKGIALVNMDRYDEAEENFGKVLKLDKNNGKAHFHLGNIMCLKGEFEKGVMNYNIALSDGYEDAELFYNLGLAHEELKETTMALRNYSKAIGKNPLDERYYIQKSAVYMTARRYDEALAVLADLRRNIPDCFEGYHFTSGIYLIQGKYDEALKVIEKAHQMFPEDMELIYDKIRILGIQKKYDEAIRYIEKAERKSSEESEKASFLLEKAKIYMQQEKSELAEQQLSLVSKMAGDEQTILEAKYLLMNQYIALKEFEKLRDIAEEMKASGKKDIFSFSAEYYYAMALKQLDDPRSTEAYEEAIRYYRQSTLEDAGRLDGYIYRAMCYKDTGDYAKAMEVLDYLQILASDNANVHVLKGNLHQLMNSPEKAQREFDAARKINPQVFIPEEVKA